MKQALRSINVLALLVGLPFLGLAQFKLGTTQGFLSNTKNSLAASKSTSSIKAQVSANKSYQLQIQHQRVEQDQSEYITGTVKGIPSASFFIRANATSLQGHIILKSEKKAYEYYSEDGIAYVRPADINDLLCIEYDHHGSNKGISAPSSTKQIGAALLNLQSLPGARGCVMLDFDGHYVSGTPWNGGNPINAAPSGMSDAAIQEAWEIVAEDFRPFNVNITTNEAVFNSYPKNLRMRNIFSPTNTAAPGAGGVAYIGSFSWNDDTPCWVFILSGKAGGEAASHEIGHTFSLGHDGRTNPSEGYFQGHGSWAPIMGVGYYRPISQWSKGEYNYSNNKEDDLTKIANYVGVRTDVHGNATSSAAALNVATNGSVSASQNSGIIERTTDQDFFSFNSGSGTLSLNVNTVSRHGDLDIIVRLHNSAGTVIGTYNPTGLNASLSASVTAGTYYISVDGTGSGNPATDGYSDYASLGSYSISGTVPPSSSNRPPAVSITAPANNANYNAPANITINANASDPDGTVSKVEFYYGATKIGEDASSPYSFNWNNVTAGTYTITARATDNAGAVTTSTAITVVVNTVNGVATFYQHCNYDATGYAIQLPLGSYTTAQLVAAGIRDNDVSSLKVNSGYQVTLFNGDNFTGTSLVVTGDNSCLVANSFNDIVSSIRISTVSQNQLPSVSITSPGNNASFTAPASITINANASDADGTISSVQFFNGAASLGSDASAPYSFSWTNVAAGTYTITARATDNAGGSTTSSAITITVTNPQNQLPTVSITSPGNGASFTAPASITINASASDADGSISSVQFFNGATSLGTDATAPYSFSWTNVAAGSYTITARATDNAGGTRTSAAISITVSSGNNDACASLPQYIENGGYVAGGKVKNVGRQYECKEWPYSGWCNGAAWAYAPGTGMYWGDAWYDRGSCTARIGSSDLNEAAEKLLTLAPNPTQNSITFEFNEIETSVNIIFFDAFGNSVKEVSGLSSGNTVDVSSLPSGVYTLRIVGENGVYSRKVVKN